MALKSNREGLRRELVDYLGNIIIDKKLKQDIITAIDNLYVNESDVLTLEEIQASSDLSGKVISASALKIEEVTSISINDSVVEHHFYKIGNIVFGRFNFNFSSDTATLIQNLPSPLVSGYFSIFQWDNGNSLNGSVYVSNEGSCTRYGPEFTGTAGCVIMYLCS